MAVSVVTRYSDLPATTYDEVIASLDLDANPPAGAILHIAGGDEDGFVICEVWQTEQTFRAFYDYRFRPALRLHGVEREPMVEVAPLRNVFAAESVPSFSTRRHNVSICPSMRLRVHTTTKPFPLAAMVIKYEALPAASAPRSSVLVTPPPTSRSAAFI